jgi:hypothetical protein
MPPSDDALLRQLTEILRTRMPANAPAWTDHGDNDAGVTLIELFASLAEAMIYRAAQIPDRTRMSAAAIMRAALARLEAPGGRDTALVERPRYLAGQLLTPQDLQAEQDYVRARTRRHNRHLHGVGVVTGLDVAVAPGDDGGGWRVVVTPGFAIAPDGEEIEVPCRASVALPDDLDAGYVCLLFHERPTRAIPGGSDTLAHSRVEETFAVEVAAAPLGEAVMLARLVRSESGWRVDDRVSPPRIASCR